ncbi:MAG: 4-hydroxythreonine-4-phosphate dehydrogenase PdxA [Endomicrobiales bacterium]|nr:4-hydroxythreonine-4-phosphate dehydrogenase PdxA [Endomicrobiales bacterium]
MLLPRIAITIGDPAGIGPEVVSKSLSSKDIYKACKPIVICDRQLIPNYQNIKKKFKLNFLEVSFDNKERIKPGRISKESGRYSYELLLKAVEVAENGVADAMVTAPVSKEAMKLAGVNYPGQTELLAAITSSKEFAMLMIAGKLRTAMVTRHMPVSEVGRNLTIDKIKNTTLMSSEFLKKRLNIRNPKIAVCSLNPHGGEGGILGKEDRMFILPAVNILKDLGLNISGPIPCDSAWVKMKKGEFDLLVTMYHDQAMIGLKCLDPRKVVNVTAGIPFIRTSPGHGTGFDIAGKNTADPKPMIEAIKLASYMCQKHT